MHDGNTHALNRYLLEQEREDRIDDAVNTELDDMRDQFNNGEEPGFEFRDVLDELLAGVEIAELITQAWQNDTFTKLGGHISDQLNTIAESFVENQRPDITGFYDRNSDSRGRLREIP